VCPILSCNSILASFLGSGVTRLAYLFDGTMRSVFFILLYCYAACHSFCVHFFSFSLDTCISANLLCGNLFFSSFYSLLRSLPPSVITFFASSFAFSFPSTPLCPGIHLTFIFIPLCFLCSVSTSLWITLKM
jgi:hypothetical protein